MGPLPYDTRSTYGAAAAADAAADVAADAAAAASECLPVSGDRWMVVRIIDGRRMAVRTVDRRRLVLSKRMQPVQLVVLNGLML